MPIGPRKVCLAGASALALAAVVCAFTLGTGFPLTVLGNLAQAILLFLAAAVMWMNVRASHGNARIFWIFMAAGCALWFTAQMFWVYYEVVRRTEVPDPSLVDSIFFLHIVPFMAAVALRPHRRHGSGFHIGSVDFALLLVWWIYLYSFIVVPWQYVVPDHELYARSFNILYVFQQVVLLAALAYMWWRSRAGWRRVYGQMFGASLLYAASSRLVNWAIDRDVYYTGSIYDLPLVLSMVWFVAIGVWAPAWRLEAAEDAEAVEGAAVWPARLAMAAILSLPALGAWAVLEPGLPVAVESFRLLLTLGAILLLTFLVFLKQHLMDRELIRLLAASRRSYDDLQRLQAQLIHSEKMASLGQLVAGAAHEINNPLTAILGYTDMLTADAALSPEPKSLVGKIEQQARRTKTLVSHLLSFAKQVPADKSLVSIGGLLRNAIKLREIDISARGLRVEWKIDEDLPPVWGDGNQLLQVCYHILNNALDALHGTPSGLLSISATRVGSQVVIDFSDNGPGIRDPQRIFDPFYTTKPVGQGTGLGLSASYGIVHEHGGSIACFNRDAGGATITVRLPIAVVPQPAASEPEADAASVSNGTAAGS